MQEGHRRLKEAFKKTKDLENDVPSLLSTSHILEKESLDFGATRTTQHGKGVTNKSTALDEEVIVTRMHLPSPHSTICCIIEFGCMSRYIGRAQPCFRSPIITST